MGHALRAGICMYGYHHEIQELCVLLVKQRSNKGIEWTMPGGKRFKHGGKRLAREALRDTAAREIEEETHYQIPQCDIRPKLDKCAGTWWVE